jgi:hypothetical protein
MSQVTPTEESIIRESNARTAKWADYESAYAEFDKLRGILIRDIMQMDVKQGSDFYSVLQHKIEDFKRGETLKKIARSVISG